MDIELDEIYRMIGQMAVELRAKDLELARLRAELIATETPATEGPKSKR